MHHAYAEERQNDRRTRLEYAPNMFSSYICMIPTFMETVLVWLSLCCCCPKCFIVFVCFFQKLLFFCMMYKQCDRGFKLKEILRKFRSSPVSEPRIYYTPFPHKLVRWKLRARHTSQPPSSGHSTLLSARRQGWKRDHVAEDEWIAGRRCSLCSVGWLCLTQTHRKALATLGGQNEIQVRESRNCTCWLGARGSRSVLAF